MFYLFIYLVGVFFALILLLIFNNYLANIKYTLERNELYYYRMYNLAPIKYILFSWIGVLAFIVVLCKLLVKRKKNTFKKISDIFNITPDMNPYSFGIDPIYVITILGTLLLIWWFLGFNN